MISYKVRSDLDGDKVYAALLALLHLEACMVSMVGSSHGGTQQVWTDGRTDGRTDGHGKYAV